MRLLLSGPDGPGPGVHLRGGCLYLGCLHEHVTHCDSCEQAFCQRHESHADHDFFRRIEQLRPW